MTGMSGMHNAFAEAAMKDMTSLVPISFAVMFVLLALLAGGLVGTFTTIVVITLSIAGALGLTGYYGFFITPTSAPAPSIILTVAVANLVHILVSYFHELRQGIAKHAALEESLRINIHPVALASLTTAIGFMTMNFSEVPPFQQMGTIIATGVVFSFVLSVTLLPALLTVLPTGRIRQSESNDKWIERLGDFVVRRRRGLLWGTSVAIIVIVANAPRNEFNDFFLHYFDETMEFRVATDFTADNLTGLYTIHYALDSGETGGISDPDFLKVTHEFTEWWRLQPEIEHVSSITDTMKRLNKNMHGDDPAMYKLPNNRNLAAQYLLLYEMSLPYGLDLNKQINVDKSATRVIATLKPLSLKQTFVVTDRAGAWLDEHAPTIGHDNGTGMAMMFSHLVLSNINSMIVGSLVALVLMSGVLVIALKSIKIGLLSLVTNLVPVAMGFGVWAIMDGDVGMSLQIVASMTLGIVVDDTVHFLSKYLRAQREQGMHPHDAVRYAVNTVGWAGANSDLRRIGRRISRFIDVALFVEFQNGTISCYRYRVRFSDRVSVPAAATDEA
ncbi:MAG: putative RND superfamily exporter protein [Gammaproteobacteria bacterium]|jgi:predicted RND superfamily exporter protein